MAPVQPGNSGDDEDGTPSPAPQPPHGPLVWLNWQAMKLGQPARTSSRTDSILIQASWEEWGLYSDARVVGELEVGPYRLLLAFPPRRSRLGLAQIAVVLRAVDHLADPGHELMDLRDPDVRAYAGGDLGNQMASLLALSLGCRLSSGGVIRRGYDRDQQGKPFYAWHHVPRLHEPRERPLLPAVAEEARLEDAKPHLEAYADLSGEQAVVIQRAANQYADALWWADADPRIAWIKLFGALESAANFWAVEAQPDAVDVLKRRRGRLYGDLKRVAPEGIPVVANALARTLGAQSKMVDFVLAHAPAPPQQRPAWGRLDWAKIEPVLDVLYDHRSRDLHDGIPFPAPLCRGPEIDEHGVAAEVFPALGAQELGGSWPAASLPVYLHTFAYLAGGALRRWWLELGAA
jgi:hypothetical protein